MPVTIKSSQVKVKGTDGYVGIDALADSTTASRVAAITSAGATVLENIQEQGTSTEEAVAQAAAAARASIPGEYTQLSDDVSELKSAIDNQGKEIFSIVGNPLIEFTDNAYIAANGTTIDINAKVANTEWRCAVVQCRYKDVFVLNAVGGNGVYRVYAIVDTDGNRLYSTGANITLTDYRLEIGYENAAYLVINDKKSGGVCYRNAPSVETVTKIGTRLHNLAFTTEEITSFVVGANITTNVGIGNVVDTTPNPNASWSYVIVQCKAGDVFKLTGTGGGNARLWAFVDSEYILRSVSPSDANVVDVNIKASDDGYLIINATITSSPHLEHSYYFEDAGEKILQLQDDAARFEEDITDIKNKISFVTITDPRQLRWLFGFISSSGNWNKNNTAVVLDAPISVQGGYIRPDSTGLVQMQYRVYDNDAFIYRTWNTSGIDITTPTTYLRVGFRYTDTSVKCNDISILDHVEVNLKIKIDDYYPADYKARNVVFDFAPAISYIGQHIDATGFGQNTSYADSQALWRALPAQSNGYITETELGAIYAGGPVMYKYTLNPPYQARSGKNLPHVFIVTSIHGHEKSSTYGLYYLVKDLLEHANDNPVLTFLRNYVKFTVIPMANPWGWDQNKRQNENGVNLNRNFSTSAWSKYDEESTYITPGAYNYRGESPFSEIETQFIRDAVIAEQDDITLMIDGHTNGLNTTDPATIASPMLNSKNTDIEAVKATAIGADMYISGLKTHMDALYGTNLGNIVYGSFLVYGPDELNIEMKDWGHESVRCVSCILEMLCGTDPDSAEAGYLGERLYKYSPDVIKLCGEMFGNFIAKVLYMLNKTQL